MEQQAAGLGEHAAGSVAAPRPRLYFAWRAIWRSRGFWLGAIALGFALYGQYLVVAQRAIVPAIRWYAAGIVLLLIAWLGTYKNSRELRVASCELRVESQNSQLATRNSQLRYVLAFVALGINLFSAALIRADYSSMVGGIGWAAGLLLLLFAFVGHKPARVAGSDEGTQDIEGRTDLRVSRRLEAAIFLGIFLLAFAMRFYRLGDLAATGIYADEGAAGLDAIRVMENRVSPFLIGWFWQPNFYYWSIGLLMQVFGHDLLGLRMFSFLAGMLMFPPFYLLVRLWFGVRTAVIASALLAISGITINYARIELSNITTPLALVTGFYFLSRGLRSKRMTDFVLSGYGFMSGLYFFVGARLTPLMVAAALVYLFLLIPVVSLPGAYKQLRKLEPALGRPALWRRALRGQARSVSQYGSRLLIFVTACFCFAAPWLVYYLDHKQSMDIHPTKMLIFNNPDYPVSRYGLKHEPLHIGLRMPNATDIYPVLPVVFERTPASIKLADDGFWPRALWSQTTATLSILSYRQDGSAWYPTSGEGIVKPVEAALIILGVVWALWRWRDTRMGMLSLWFWSTIFAGNVLTIGAPYVARLVGILPLLAIFAALILSKLTAEFLGLARRLGPRAGPSRRVAPVLSGSVLLVLLGCLAWQNFNDYYFRYLPDRVYGTSTGIYVGRAYFVREMTKRVMGEGRPVPMYYNLTDDVYWDEEVNSFLNRGTPGTDMVFPTDELPAVKMNDRDVVFIVWESHGEYLTQIKAAYPKGEEAPFYFSPDGKSNYLFTSYRVKREDLKK